MWKWQTKRRPLASMVNTKMTHCDDDSFVFLCQDSNQLQITEAG